ncbi:MAG: hypothetical protein ACXWH0_16680 [Acidimicrobiia bacterium]
MTETSIGSVPTLEDGGAMELVRVPAWDAQYKLGQDEGEVAYMFCCRDLDWSKTVCGYVDPDPVIMHEATNVCTMCVEAAGGPDGPIASAYCPFDDQPCPDDETIDRMIAERTSRP